MLLKKLKDFHERTMEQYKEEENLEPWKKKVMELHEKSAFLFYYDATLEENAEQNSLIIQGSLVEGELPIGSTVYLYTGEGKYLGSGRILSEPEEKEQGKNKNVPSYRSECFADFGTSDLRSKVDAFEESLFPIFVTLVAAC